MVAISRFSTNQLWKIAAYTGLGVATTGIVLNLKMQDQVKKYPFYKDALSLVRKNSGAVSLFGEPIKAGRCDRNDFSDNVIQYKVRLSGPNKKGYLFFETECASERRVATENDWKLVRAELEIDGDSDKRLRIL